MAKEDAAHWLKLAREARERGAKLTDPFGKRTMRMIAQQYELLAERVEEAAKQARQNKSA
jgi:hypothetical protein